jgi:methionyl-tRNA synthetase
LGDALTRWHKFCGKKTFFVAGTDEHGSKVEQAAKNNGFADVQLFCDTISNEYKILFEKANVRYCFRFKKCIAKTITKQTKTTNRFLMMIL